MSAAGSYVPRNRLYHISLLRLKHLLIHVPYTEHPTAEVECNMWKALRTVPAEHDNRFLRVTLDYGCMDENNGELN